VLRREEGGEKSGAQNKKGWRRTGVNKTPLVESVFLRGVTGDKKLLRRNPPP